MKNVLNIVEFHKHIDNGGLTIDFRINEYLNARGEAEYYAGSIVFNADYFGYPSFETIFHDCGQLTPSDYREIAAKFVEYADELEAVRSSSSANI